MWNKKLSYLLAFFSILLILYADFAMAGPGAIIKEAGKTFWGKVIFIGFALFFAPLIIWFSIKRSILIRKTRKLLNIIAKQDPRYDWMRVKQRVTEVFYWVHSAWDQQKMQLAEAYVSEWYLQNQQLQLDKWRRDGLENIVSDVKIKRMVPVFVSYSSVNSDKNCIIVEIEAEMRDYLQEINNGKVVQGDKTLGVVTTVWSLIWEEDNWRLNMIEAEETAMDYLQENDFRILRPSHANN